MKAYVMITGAVFGLLTLAPRRPASANQRFRLNEL
jgi:hypothetical protein